MDSDQAKLFVGGISWETDEDTLKDHFSKYGDVASTVIMRDRNTNATRGFGFVSFSEPAAADKALQEKHDILGRTVEVKKAVPRSEQQQQHNQQQQQNKGSGKNHTSNYNTTNGGNSQLKTKKIFVGGLAPSLTEEEFKSYFEKFGKIIDVVVMYDSVTHRPRGFGFITFDSEDAVEQVMQKKFHELNDKLVEVKKAIPKDGVNGSNGSGSNGYGMRTGGSGRGSVVGNFRGGFYPHYSPQYGVYQSYGGPPPVSGYGNVAGYPYGGGYSGGYSMGVYGGIGYGAQMTPPRSPWNGVGVFGARRSPAPYGNPASAYSGYVNGGVGGYMGIGTGYRGVTTVNTNGKWNQGNGDVQVSSGNAPGGTPPHTESTVTEDSPSFSGTNATATEDHCTH
ncbi:heterogeneous nuclear ribonucleoprotein 1-like isoform X2 [Aristolochia californica]|uniref:heterogeneous nuclear ribonucleoprotein 1-like isoform X2 n=1 Tax=Aristolochia californica TaxID=171875 RepID=UPI0035D94E4A